MRTTPSRRERTIGGALSGSTDTMSVGQSMNRTMGSMVPISMAKPMMNLFTPSSPNFSMSHFSKRDGS